MPWNAIWEKHKKFLLTVVGGLAVFLIATSWLQSYRSGAVAKERSNDKLAGAIEKQMEALDFSYYKNIKESGVLDKRLKNLLGKVTLEASSTVKVPDGSEDPVIDFRRQKDRIWSNFDERANRINLRYPTQRDVGFNLSSDLTAEEWQDRYRQLEIVRRMFEAAVDLRFHRIDSVFPGTTYTESIPGSKTDALVRYPVEVKLAASYGAIVQLFERFQRDGAFVGLELNGLTRELDDPEGIVRADISFVGIDVGAPRDTKKRGRRGSFRGGRKR